VKHTYFLIVVISVSILNAMDDPSKQAHVAPPLIKALPIVGPSFVKYSLDGRYLVSGTNYKIYVTDTQEYQTKWNPSLPSTQDNLAGVNDLSSTNQIISTMAGKPIALWDIPTETSWDLAEVTKTVVLPVFNNKGDQLAAGQFFDDLTKDEIVIFDLNSNKYIAHSRAGALPYGVWNPHDNNEVCAVSGTVEGPKKVQVWDRRADKLRHIEDFATNFCSANWSNDGKLVIGCPGYFAVCDAKTAAQLMYYNLHGKKIVAPPVANEETPGPTALHFMSGEKMRTFDAAFYDNIYYCDFDDPSQSFDFPPVANPNGNMCNIDISPSGKQLAVANFSLSENGVEILDISPLSLQKKALAEVKETVKEQQQAKNRYWGTCRQQ
jgi:WD40 repeat protein